MVKDHTHDKPDFYNDLDKTYENIWDQLIIGKSKSKSELHQGIFQHSMIHFHRLEQLS